MKKRLAIVTYGWLLFHRNPGLLHPAEQVTVADLTSVLQAVAEGLQAALAA